MHRAIVLAGIVWLSLAAPGTVAAQALPQPFLEPVAPGAVLEPAAQPSAVNLAASEIPASALSTSIVQGEDRPSFIAHVLVGAVAGGLAGGAWGLYVDANATEGYHIPGTVAGVVIGVPVGALIGAMVWSMKVSYKPPPEPER